MRQRSSTEKRGVKLNPVQQVRTIDEASQFLKDGTPRLLIRFPLDEVIARAARVTAIAADFDGTLVPGNQWRELQRLLPQDQQAEEERIRDWYFDHTKEGHRDDVPLDSPDWFHSDLHPGNRLVAEGAWVASSIERYMKAGVTRAQITKLAQQMPARVGAFMLLGHFKTRAVISFGLEPFIVDWLAYHGTTASVAASRLLFNEGGQVNGYHINIVGSETKEFAADVFRRKAGLQEHELLVVGDSVVDAHMMRPGGLNFLVIPPKEGDKRMTAFRNAHLDTMWDRITGILVSDELLDLVALLNLARANPLP